MYNLIDKYLRLCGFSIFVVGASFLLSFNEPASWLGLTAERKAIPSGFLYVVLVSAWIFSSFELLRGRALRTLWVKLIVLVCTASWILNLVPALSEAYYIQNSVDFRLVVAVFILFATLTGLIVSFFFNSLNSALKS